MDPVGVAIEFDRVGKTYPGAAAASVQDVTLTLPAGTFAVVLGPSGCGKSTLLRAVAGLETITAGELRLGGVRVNEREPKDRGCAMVFQTYALYPHMTAAQNIAYPLKVAGMNRAARDARVREVAETLALSALLDRRPGQLSGGQRQRVAIGRAMVRSPRVFLFDEPLSNLDATLRVQMRAELRRIHDRLGVTSVLVTHDQVEAMTLADLLVVMNAGRVEQAGAPREVYERPQTRFVAGFMGSPAMNLWDGTVAPGGDTLLVPGGTNLPLTGLPLPGRYEPGAPLTLGVRPEHVTEEPGGLAATCEMIEDLGTTRLVHARAGGLPVMLHVPVERGIARGDAMALHLPAGRMHVFDGATGRRMEAGPGARSLAA